jgi:hypothetical protein
MIPPQDEASGGESESPNQDPLRRRIAREAGRGVAGGSDARRAVFRAARRVAGEWVPADQLPGPAEVREEAHRRIDPAGSLAHLTGDRFDTLAAMVAVLATVKQNPDRHPEGDALEHTLQVFDLVQQERPYDEELLTAALVHDLGRAIDRRNAVAATLEAVGNFITPRTRWLVESLPAARAYDDGTLGHRARRRLEAHPDFLDVLLLAEADRRGRARGYDTPSLDAAIAALRGLEDQADGG